MKLNKQTIITLVTLIVFSIIYRVLPYRVDGFMPQIALGIFAGYLFNTNKKIAFVLPLISMLLSDTLYHILYLNGNVSFKGFYGWWQIAQYACIMAVAAVGFYIKKLNVLQIGIASVAAPTIFFLLSNFFVWVEGAGYAHSYTFNGLLQCYLDGVPFYQTSLQSTMLFSAIIFGIYYFVNVNKDVKQFAE